MAWLSLDESDRQPATFWTYVITALQTAVPGVGAERAPAAAVGPAADRDRPRRGAQRTRGRAERRRPRARRLPPRRRARHPRRHDVPAGAPPAAGPSGDQQPRRPAPAAGSAAGPRRTGRDPRHRPAFHARRSGAPTSTTSSAWTSRPTDIAALEGRTEGWIAALQLAALSMQGRTDIGGFIAGFAGDDRYIVDYLVEEVLQRQTEQVRTFLLRTCLLDRLNGPLCDAVTGEPRRQGHSGGAGPRQPVPGSARRQPSLVPLPPPVRGHVAGPPARMSGPTRSPICIAEPATGTTSNGQPSPAVRHALAAGDVERAADLVELAIPALRRNRQDATIRGWVDVIPYEVVRMRPVLAVGLIGGLMVGAEFEGVEERLRDAERWLEPAAHDRDGTAHACRGDGGRRRGGARPPPRGDRDVSGRAGVGCEVTSPPPSGTPSWRSTARLTNDHVTRGAASALSGLALWGRGRSRRRASRVLRSASRGCDGPGTSPTSWDARSRWPTSASPRVAWATRCAPTSRHCSSPPRNPGRCSAERRTCTWA